MFCSSQSIDSNTYDCVLLILFSTSLAFTYFQGVTLPLLFKFEVSGVAPKRSASPAQGPPPKRPPSPITPASLTPSSSQHEEPVCYRVVLETPPLARKTLEIELDDLWNRFGIEYQIVGSSPNLMDMSLITHPVVEHPWIKYWSTPGVTSSMSNFVVDESSATSSSCLVNHLKEKKWIVPSVPSVLP